MKVVCVFGRHNYGDPARGLGYEYSNIVPAFHRLGHETVFFESWDRSAHRNFCELNDRLVKTVAAEKPDIIFCVLMGYEVWLETLDLIRHSSEALLLNWSTDDSWKYDQFSRFLASYFDVYITTSARAVAKAQRDGLSNVFLSQWAANAESLVAPLPSNQCRYEASFIGSAYGNRGRWIRELKRRGIDVACFGHGWRRGPLPGAEIPTIIRESFISLNFSDSSQPTARWIPGRSRQIKARVFEVPGAGGFLMTQNAERLEDFYLLGKEVVTFDGIDDLVDSIRYFKAHPDERDRIARAGHRRTRSEHTYDMRFAELFDLVQTLRAKGQQRTPLRPVAAAKTMADLQRVHHAGYLSGIFRMLLLIPCIALFGLKKGPRAARRLVYELSWRLVGRKTYMASGLPGRLFYKES